MYNYLLLVDNDHDRLEVVAMHFIQDGYRVISVPSANQAAQAVAKHLFQVAVIDIDTSGFDGIALMHRLKAECPQLEVIAICNRDYPTCHARREGAFACIERPFSLKKLETIIEDAFESASFVTLSAQ